VQRLAALVLLLAAAAHAQTTGSADCPCITTTDANYAPYAFMGNTTASTCRPFATVTSAKTDHGYAPALRAAPYHFFGEGGSSAVALHRQQCPVQVDQSAARACVNNVERAQHLKQKCRSCSGGAEGDTRSRGGVAVGRNGLTMQTSWQGCQLWSQRLLEKDGDRMGGGGERAVGWKIIWSGSTHGQLAVALIRRGEGGVS
jgi:hypothetical protein